MLKPGDRFGDYTVVRLLGEGGMGAVFLLESVSGGRVAAKILDSAKSGDHASRRRFLREAELALGVSHPNLVETYDVGEDPDTGLCYILMEYVPGGSLADRIDRGPLAVNDAIRIVYQIASVLELARQKGVVHRDIKPGNILFGADGRAKLADLGIARGGHAGLQTTVTQTGMMIGTPAYMSPEQMLDSHSVDIRADIYSLGVVFFEMLAGERPNADDTVVQLMAKAVKGDPLPDVRTLRPEVPALLAKLIAMMVAPDRKMRFSTPGQLMDAIAVVARGGSPKSDSGRTRLLLRQVLPPVGLVVVSLVAAWAISHARKDSVRTPLPKLVPELAETSNAVVEVVVQTNQTRQPAPAGTVEEVVPVKPRPDERKLPADRPSDGHGSNVVERQSLQVMPTGVVAKVETNAVQEAPPPREEKKPADEKPDKEPEPLPVAKTYAAVDRALKSTVLAQFEISPRQSLERSVDAIRASLKPRVNFFVLRSAGKATPRFTVNMEMDRASHALKSLCDASGCSPEVHDNVVCIAPRGQPFRWKSDSTNGDAGSVKAALSKLRLAKFKVQSGQSVGDVLELFRKKTASEPDTSGIRWMYGRSAGDLMPRLQPMDLEDVSVWTALKLFCAGIGWEFDCTSRRIELHPPVVRKSAPPGGSSRFSQSEIRRMQDSDGEEAMRETIRLLFRGWRLSDSQQAGFFRKSRRRGETGGQNLGYVAEHKGLTDVLRTSGTGSIMEYGFKKPVRAGCSLSFSVCGDKDARILVMAGSRVVRDCGTLDSSEWRPFVVDLSQLAGEKPILTICVKVSPGGSRVMHWHGIRVGTW